MIFFSKAFFDDSILILTYVFLELPYLLIITILTKIINKNSSHFLK